MTNDTARKHDYSPESKAVLEQEGMTVCAYCDAEVYPTDAEQPSPAGEGFTVPSADNDQAWANIADHHMTGCEWVTTRGHQIA